MKANSLYAVVLLAFALTTAPLDAGEQKEPLQVGDTVEDVGTFIDMESGDRLQFVINEDDHKVYLYVVDKENTIVENKIESVIFEVDEPGKHDDFRTMMYPAQGQAAIVSSRTLYPPYTFRTDFIIRFTEGDPSTFSNVRLILDRNLSD